MYSAGEKNLMRVFRVKKKKNICEASDSQLKFICPVSLQERRKKQSTKFLNVRNR